MKPFNVVLHELVFMSKNIDLNSSHYCSFTDLESIHGHKKSEYTKFVLRMGLNMLTYIIPQ